MNVRLLLILWLGIIMCYGCCRCRCRCRRYCFACLLVHVYSLDSFDCTLDWSSKNGNETKWKENVTRCSKVKEEENKSTFWTVHKYGCNGFCIWITGSSPPLLQFLSHFFYALQFLFVSTSLSTLQCKLILLILLFPLSFSYIQPSRGL